MDGNIRRKGFFLPPISTNSGSPNKGELKGREVTQRELSRNDKRLLEKLQKRRLEKVCSYLREQQNSPGKSASSFEFKKVGGVDCCEIPGVFIGSGAANTQLLAVDLTNERLCALSERVLQDPSSSAKSISLDSPYSSSINNGYSRDSCSDSSPVSSSNSSPLTIETNFDLPTPSPQNSFGGL